MEEQARERYGEPITNRLRLLSLAGMFDRKAGTWLFAEESPTGPKFSPSTVRAALVSYSVMLRRQLAGQAPWDHPVSRMTRSQWAASMSHLVAPDEMDKRLTDDELRRAQAYAAELKK
jgi:hypothetical protein